MEPTRVQAAPPAEPRASSDPPLPEHVVFDWKKRLIYSGRHPGLAGVVGRWWGRRAGLRLASGARMIIDSPAEDIQFSILCWDVFEWELAAVVTAALRPGELFFDIGANIGHHTLVAAQHGAQVHAFEAVPRLARRVRQNAQMNRFSARVHVFNCAVSREVGQADFFVAEREDDGSHSLIAGVHARAVDRITIPTTTIDSHIAAQSCGVPRLIKIDVEGAEALVLDGARNTLCGREQPVVIIETGYQALRIGETATAVLQRLFDRDYRIFYIDTEAIIHSQGKDRRVREALPGQIGLEGWEELADFVAVPRDSDRRDGILATLQSTVDSVPIDT